MDYFYFVGILLVAPIWLYLFINKVHRKDMLLIGVFLGIGAVVIECAYPSLDYWRPVYLFPHFPFENFLYGFIFGGISAELYEVFWKIRDSKKSKYRKHKGLIALFTLMIGIIFWVFVDVLGFNSIVADILPPIIVGITVGILRVDLFKFELFNGFMIALLTLVVFNILLFIYPHMFEKYWMLENLSGYLILRVPIEEILFAFAVGFGTSCFYELIYGYSEVKAS